LKVASFLARVYFTIKLCLVSNMCWYPILTWHRHMWLHHFFSLLFQVIFNVDMSVSMPYSVPISMFVIHSRDGEWSCNEPSMETAGWVLICVLCHIRKKSNPSLLATNDDVCNVQLVKVQVQVHSLRMVPLDWLNF
jgi:hypothetical protein